MKNKKADSLFLPFVVLVTLITITSLFVVFYNKNSSFKSYPVGKRQFELMNTYLQSEKIFFYIDQSAKYSLQQSVYDLAQNGGAVQVEEIEAPAFEAGTSLVQSSCGKFYGYQVWYELRRDAENNYVKNECIDDNKVKINLEYLFSEKLEQYLFNSPYDIRSDNYDYEIKNSLEIIGRAKEPLNLLILKDETKPAVKKPVEVKIEAAKPKTTEGQTATSKTQPEPKTPSPSTAPTTAQPEKIPAEYLDFVAFSGTELCAKGVKCELSKDAFQLLLKAQDKAKEKGVSLEVTQGYRSLDEQIAIWEGKTPERYAQRYPDEKARARYVCSPYGENAEKRCPHLTGNSVDVRFKGKTFSTMTPKDWLLLHEIMSADWVRYGDEKVYSIGERWHFECCNTARYKKAKELETATGQPVTAIV